jgi:ABC-type transport system involved in multi-copper enzyme maturation permease subunit
MTWPPPHRMDRPPQPPWLTAMVVLMAQVVAGGCLMAFVAGLPTWLQLMLCLSVLLPVPLFMIAGTLRTVGPVVPCELLRCGRRDRYILMRCLYGAVLIGVLAWSYLTWFANRGIPTAELLWGEGTLPPEEMPKFAAHFFTAFLTAQLAAVLILTPIYLGAAVAEERERRTLEFLLATDLSGREIVVSKLLARLLVLGLLLLTGLPVLALTQLWGGVDPFRVAAGFAATGVTMLSVGSLAVFCSAGARQPVQAVLQTYALLAGALVFACIPGFNLGHPVLLVVTLASSEDANVFVALFLYTVLHLTVAYLLVQAATTRLRYAEFASIVPVELGPQPSLTAGEAPATFLPPGPPPPMGDRPLAWKEHYIEPHFRWDRLKPLFGLSLLFVGVMVGLLCVGILLTYARSDLGTNVLMNQWARWVGTPLAGSLLAMTGFYAAGAVTRERERQTLDGLLTLPDGRTAVLAAKWRGGFRSTRQAWWCLGAVWGLGVLTGGVNVIAVPLLLVGFVVYLGFVTSLGLFCSTVCRSTLRATLATEITLLVLASVPWLLWWGRDLLLPASLSPELRSLAGGFLGYGLPPPMALWAFAFSYGRPELPEIGGALAGLLVYGVADALLWLLAQGRFRAEAGPAPRRPGASRWRFRASCS